MEPAGSSAMAGSCPLSGPGLAPGAGAEGYPTNQLSASSRRDRPFVSLFVRHNLRTCVLPIFPSLSLAR